jgi:hypothetical protein
VHALAVEASDGGGVNAQSLKSNGAAAFGASAIGACANAGLCGLELADFPQVARDFGIINVRNEVRNGLVSGVGYLFGVVA